MVALAVIPGIVLLVYIWKKDKVEKEPFKAIMGVVAAGAAVTAGCADAAG